ncbi:unnamed protein product [Moneuplotes crassus]|uniref:RanBP-type and C3HC4-type zinc finger-containing protein 1 n=1 Tax=Euplotes crassus TaxID=5936 RepID=A0AAD1XNL0_EUPCR|nr:unnamed protein product [Moneuplotes crassus]
MECSICMLDYHDVDRIPKVLPKCGHTFCVDCIQALVKDGKIQCVECRLIQKCSKIASLPTNFAIFELTHIIRKLKKENETLKNSGAGMDLSHILDEPLRDEVKEPEKPINKKENCRITFADLFQQSVSMKKERPKTARVKAPTINYDHLMGKWNCPQCTYENSYDDYQCQICGYCEVQDAQKN